MILDNSESFKNLDGGQIRSETQGRGGNHGGNSPGRREDLI
jgi:hypothetical protein